MKLTVPVSFFLCVVLSALISIPSFSQISIQSTRGYSVNVNITPEQIVPSSSSCTWGYNYNIRFNYSVVMSGNNVPGSLYTLQGNINSNGGSHFFQLPRTSGSGTATTRSNVWRGVSDCAVATISSLNITTVDLQIEGDGISSRTVSFAMIIPLPVKLVSFTAVPGLQNVKLNWTTATETDNDHFTVERSTDEDQWTAIRKIKGAGNSSSLMTYEAYDDAPVNGTAYYRLKQTDIDGTTSYSDIRVVNRNSAAKSISIYPVPNTGNTINIAGISEYKNYELQVLNAGGHILFSSVLSKASVELPSLATGVYFVRVKNKVSGEATNLRYVKI